MEEQPLCFVVIRCLPPMVFKGHAEAWGKSIHRMLAQSSILTETSGIEITDFGTL